MGAIDEARLRMTRRGASRFQFSVGECGVSVRVDPVHVEDTRLGHLFRAVRIHRRLRQEDLARLARTSQVTISRIERGLYGTLSIDVIRRVASALEIRLDLIPSWRGGDLDRVVNVRHSALHERLADRLSRSHGWVSAAEVSFSIWGERGVIDRLAFHPERRMLAVFEVKADLSDPAGLVAQVDRYRRLAPEIVRGREWQAAAVSCWAIVADTDTNRRRLKAHHELLRGAFPAGRRELGALLRDPASPIDGLAFVAYPQARTGTRSLTAVKRVRLAKTA